MLPNRVDHFYMSSIDDLFEETKKLAFRRVHNTYLFYQLVTLIE